MAIRHCIVLLLLMDSAISQPSPASKQHLPQEQAGREALIREIERYRDALGLDALLHEEKMRQCELRMRLIRNYGMSLERIDNL